MKALVRLLLVALTTCTAAGCVVGQSLPTVYAPPSPSERVVTPDATTTVLVSVTDDRPFVKSGKEPPYYLGKYRAAIGTPWDVTTENKEPLANLLARDLRTDVAASGYRIVTSAPADRSLVVSIRDLNFTGYQNGRFWYDLLVTVLDAGGAALATSEIQEEIALKGTLIMGARGGFEREMPDIYARIIRKIARENTPISSALATGGS